VGWTIQGSIAGKCRRFFCSPKCPDWLWGLAGLLFSGCWGFLSQYKVEKVGWGPEADSLPPFSAMIKNEWRYGNYIPCMLYDVYRGNVYVSFICSYLYVMIF
jgi:hypothetical protein